MIKDPSKKIDKNNIIKEVRDAIFITGTYHISEIECRLNQRIDQASQVFIAFNPSVINSWFYHDGSSYYLLDPAITLLHELTHALHFLNNTYTKFHIEKAHCSFEEVITTGGATMNIVQNEIKRFSSALLDNRKKMIDVANQSIKKLKPEQIDCFLKKYNLVYKNKKITTNSVLDQNYTNKVIHRFNEINFSKELNVPYRLYYFQHSLTTVLSTNVQDPMLYSIEKGLINPIFNYKDKNRPTLHKNSLVPKDLLPFGNIETFYFYDWDTSTNPELKNELKKYEPQAVLSNAPHQGLAKPKKDSHGKVMSYSVTIPENFLPKHKSKKKK